MGMRPLALMIGLVILGVLAPGAMAASPRVTVALAKSAYGPVLFDGRGTCSTPSQAIVPDRAGAAVHAQRRGRPTSSRSAARRGAGAKGSLLSQRAEPTGSRQVTYAGRPLYYYVGDRKPGQILCQNVREFGGLWLVVRGSGAPVR